MTSDANATTTYMFWPAFEPSSNTVTDSVSAALGEHVADYDVPAIVTDVLAALTAALPDGVSIHGDSGEVIGPYLDRPQFDPREVWASVDFWAIAARHDTTTD